VRFALSSLLAALCVLTLSTPLRAQYHRTQLQVVRAIRDGNGAVSVATAETYARVIIRESKRHQFDPFTLVAMAKGESNWNPRVVNASDPGYSVGLVQIGAVIPGSACGSKSLIDTESCQKRIALLMQPTYNLQQAAALITLHRKWCRKRTGHPALFARWLSSYQGYNSRAGVTCNMRRSSKGRWYDLPIPSKTLRVMRYRRQLIRRYG
jgi:hypothetical protein